MQHLLSRNPAPWPSSAVADDTSAQGKEKKRKREVVKDFNCCLLKTAISYHLPFTDAGVLSGFLEYITLTLH